MDELKPCPFCGSDRITIMVRLPFNDEVVGYYVFCSGCGARSALNFSEEIAIEAWNRRAEDGK
jgi:Lar family restriction alleviation protein